MNNTQLLYLDSPNLLTVEAQLLNLNDYDGQTGLVFDSTPMYPQGGGQPCDSGIIKGNHAIMEVSKVSIINDTVVHFGKISGNFEPGCHYTLTVDQAIRNFHSRLHTAGEVICCVLRKYDWKVTGAKHWPGMCKIQVDTQLNAEERAELQLHLQQEVDRLVDANHTVKIVRTHDRTLAAKLCGFEPSYVKEGEEIRIIIPSPYFLGRPCMGTHVSTLGEIAKINIRSIKKDKQQIGICYDI